MRAEDFVSLLEELEEIRDVIKEIELEVSSEYEEDTGEEDEEYESFDDLKEYQERFRKYAESIKRELKNYQPREEKRNVYTETAKEKEEIKTPWERGHKLGCGCPGCTKYRENHGINLEVLNQNSDLKLLDWRSSRGRNEKKGEYKEGETKPCGGKFYHFFHGKRAEFKKLFGEYSKKLDLNLAGY